MRSTALFTRLSTTRSRPWPGWAQLLPHLTAPLRVLDVGCGNGRFGLFLVQHLGPGVTYHGIDTSPALLAHARAVLPGALLEERDALADLPGESYNLAALFGVLHHVPGAARREGLLRALAARITPGGQLAFSCWRFHEYERFRQRCARWPAGWDRETGDYLLDWRQGTRALRYCHYVDDAEHAALVAATGLDEVLTFRGDGADGALNCYSLLRRPPGP
jgi:SAM-dependent methyltransferase